MRPATLDERRHYMAQWCRFYCNGTDGRLLSDHVYQLLVEGRDPGPVYSSCADMAHAGAFRIGCRESWINREEHRGYEPYVNVSRIASHPRITRTTDLSELTHGDIAISWTKPDTSDAHVVVFDKLEAGIFFAWESGKGPLAREAWRGREYIEARYTQRSHFALKRILKLADLEFAEEPELPSGELLESIDPNYFKGPE